MGNSFFKFKQFTVHQDKCAMKVCTDACLFGAWIVQYISTKKLATDSVLDIGTGTGLLSLMLAQKSEAAKIDAIEIDPETAQQAVQNFALSPWGNRLNAIEGDVKNISTANKYSLIISNPPFFENDLISPIRSRNIALHDASLTLSELLFVVKKNLQEDGKFVVLLPFHRSAYFEQLAKDNGLFLEHKVLVRQTDKHDYFRAMMLFGTKEVSTKESELCIKMNGEYTDEFVEILRDYYLLF